MNDTAVITDIVIAETVASVRAEKDLVIAGLELTVTDLKAKLEAAVFLIDRYARKIFGRSSEVYDHPGQERIDLGAITPAAPAGPVTVIPPEAKGIVPGKEVRAGKAKRKSIPDTLEVVELPKRELSENERRLPDGRMLEPNGEQVTARLGFIPARFQKVIERVVTYGLPDEHQDQVVATAAPSPQIVPDGLPTTDTVVAICHAKYGLHLPLTRQAKEYTRLGVSIAKSTMCGWLSSLSGFINPVYQALRVQVLASNLIYSDDIPVNMLDPTAKGGTITARFWSYLGDGQVLFSFATDRRGCHPAQMLADFHGALMADALAQYQLVVTTNDIWRLGCWAHVRRAFYEARLNDRRAAEMVVLIRKIYLADRCATQRGLSGQALCRWRWRLRQRYTARVLTLIKQRLDEWDPSGISATRALPGSPLGKAVTYTLNQWKLLERFVYTGDWPLDNNAAENAQRPIAVGRKNHLFMGSEGGGEMAAKFYSLIQSCRMQNVDPVAYLKDVCQRMLAGDQDYAAMTPLAWGRSRLPSPP